LCQLNGFSLLIPYQLEDSNNHRAWKTRKEDVLCCKSCWSPLRWTKGYGAYELKEVFKWAIHHETHARRRDSSSTTTFTYIGSRDSRQI